MNTPLPPNLPASLQARLAAAGVRTTADLAAALSHDQALRAAWESFLADHDAEVTQAAVQAFMRVANPHALQTLAEQTPLLLEDGFDETVEEVIAQAEQAGETGFAEYVRLRLAALRQLKADLALPPLARALLDFVSAPDDEAASAVFEAQRILLQTAAAQEGIEQRIRANDAAQQAQLDGRRRLLRRLCASAQRSDAA